jgi:gas vesicle protein
MKLRKKYLWAITVQIITVAFMGFPLLVFGKTDGPGPMTVEDCVSRSGMTKDKCQEMMDKFKNMAPPSGGAKMMPPQNGQGQLPAGGEMSGNRPMPSTQVNKNATTTNNAEIEKMSRLQVERGQRLSQAESRIAKIIEFLKSKSVDTSEAESTFETFKTKIAAVSSAFDAYTQALNNAKTDTSETATTAVQSAKEQIKTALNDLKDSYHALRITLDDAISKLDQ